VVVTLLALSSNLGTLGVNFFGKVLPIPIGETGVEKA